MQAHLAQAERIISRNATLTKGMTMTVGLFVKMPLRKTRQLAARGGCLRKGRESRPSKKSSADPTQRRGPCSTAMALEYSPGALGLLSTGSRATYI